MNKKILMIGKKILIFIIVISMLTIVSLLFGIYLMSNPPKHDIYFDISNKKIKTCNNRPINNLSIDNDSITEKGFKKYMTQILVWDDKDSEAPKELNLNNIPKGYKIFGYNNSVPVHKISLLPNLCYVIEKFGGGSQSSVIYVYTDTIGEIYKTSHPECGLESRAIIDTIDIN